MTYIDIHTHTYYYDPETTQVLNTFPDEQEKLRLPVFCSVGLHPWHIQPENWESLVNKVAIASMNKNVIAIGETGLDKTISVPYDTQKLVFEKHLTLAEEQQKALIIHCVRSYSEILSYRKKSNLLIPWIFHWYNADEQIASELIRKNCYLSFGHMLFNENSKAFRAFKTLNPGYIFFETDDAGYSIIEIYKRAAVLMKLPLDNLKAQIRNNFNRCFNIS
jgi:TatD DNase family protein